jgi:Zn-dependent protease
VHEFAHAYVAYKLGDPTAKNLGRMNISPQSHLTLYGTIAMLFLPIGWANPVPINSRNLKNPTRGFAWVSAAGPLSNLLISFVALLLFYQVFGRINSANPLLSSTLLFLYYFATVNVGLAIFNLIPIPPLDGSRLLMLAFPNTARRIMLTYERYGFFIIIVLIYFCSPIFYQLMEWVMSGLIWLVNIV